QSEMGSLVPQCQTMLVTGSPKHGKQAVRCLHVNMNENARNHIFGQVVDALRANLEPENSNYRTAIVALGHIAYLMPEEFKYDMKSIISLKVTITDIILTSFFIVRRIFHYKGIVIWYNNFHSLGILFRL